MKKDTEMGPVGGGAREVETKGHSYKATNVKYWQSPGRRGDALYSASLTRIPCNRVAEAPRSMLTHTTCLVNTFQLGTTNFFLLPLVWYPFHFRKPLDIAVLQNRMDFTDTIPPFSLHDPDSLQRDGNHQGPVDQLNSRCLTEIQTSFITVA